jgi:hypothetical protein
MRIHFRLLSVCFVLCFALSGVVVAAEGTPNTARQATTPPIATPLTGFTAVYTLKKSGFSIGETRRTLTMGGDNRHVFESITRPTGLARLLTGGQVIERSEWRYPQNRQNQLQPLQYTFINTSRSKERNVTLLFDWEAHTVTNTINGAPWQMALPDHTQDKLLYQLQLMADLRRYQRTLNYPVADGGTLKHYTLEMLGEETIRIPLGTFDTVRIRRVHGKRKTTMWCARQLNYLPVRIEQRKGDDSPVNAILTSVKGLP